MSAVADMARTFIGVRFKHRGRDRLGLDCAGLCLASYAEAGVPLPDYRLYGREPHRDGLVRYVSQAAGDPVMVAPIAQDSLCDGDVVILRFVKEPHHMGIIGSRRYGDTDALTLIHADGEAGRVHEQRLTSDMVARITHVFRKPV